MGRAGENIRDLAFNRRVGAITSFIGGVAVALVPFGVGMLLPRIPLPMPLYLLCAVGGLFVGWQGFAEWQKAGRADQGAAGEEEIGRLLQGLPKNWKVEYGLLMRGVGDIDVVVESPSGKVWTLDVKSHQGVVFIQGEKLQRRMGNKVYPFEKDFLAAAKKQAVLLSKSRNLKFVTPVVVFSAAEVDIPQHRVQGVHVIAKARLIPFLLSA